MLSIEVFFCNSQYIFFRDGIDIGRVFLNIVGSEAEEFDRGKEVSDLSARIEPPRETSVRYAFASESSSSETISLRIRSICMRISSRATFADSSGRTPI